MDLKELSQGSMSDVLTFGNTKASSFSLSRFMLELSLSVSESIIGVLSFTGIENISAPWRLILPRRADTRERREKVLHQQKNS